MAELSDSFKLTNPLVKLIGKPPEDFTREDLIDVFEKLQLDRITFHCTGIDGKIKELKIPITSRKKAELILTDGERVDGSSLFKGIVDIGKSDMYLVPLYRSAFINPFEPGSLDFMCRFFDRDGNLSWFTPDNILSRAVKFLKQNTGLEIHTAGEIEFYMIGNPENKSYPLEKQQGYHAARPFSKTGYILNEMLRILSQIYPHIKYVHNEVGYLDKVESDFEELKGKSAEQVEVEFLPAPVEDSADSMVLASWIIRNVAYNYGYVATFFPKIDLGHAGNGLHIHIAVTKNGKNKMLKTNGALSDEALMLIGGLCRYSPSLTAFGNMIPASYLRLVPNQEAPTKVCWSDINRSALIRVPLAWSKIDNLASRINSQQKVMINKPESRQTVEFRCPDGSANAHLLLAGITMAAEWGLTNKKESMQLARMSHVSVNIHSSPSMEDLAELATSCYESSERLLQSRNLYERGDVFPQNMIYYIANQLQNENDRGLNSRLISLTEDERIFQSRRIMHKDLHKH
jgi:glutamine synthetase